MRILRLELTVFEVAITSLEITSPSFRVTGCVMWSQRGEELLEVGTFD